MRPTTTLVAVIGETAGEASRRAGERASNVAVETLEPLPDDPTRAFPVLGEAWRRARRRGLVYTLVDRDPLAPVVGEWGKRLEGEPDELETAIGLVADLPMPDYYLVDASLPAPRVHWYLGLLEELRPHRVVPVEMSAAGLLTVLGELRFGPEFPEARRVAARAREFVPLPGPVRAG